MKRLDMTTLTWGMYTEIEVMPNPVYTRLTTRRGGKMLESMAYSGDDVQGVKTYLESNFDNLHERAALHRSRKPVKRERFEVSL